MPVTYVDATSEVGPVLLTLLERHYAALVAAGVRIGLMFAYQSDEGKPVLLHHGYPAAAKVRVVPYRDRASGMPDTVIYIDAKLWEGWSEQRRLALLDHELHHLELQYDDEGQLKLDDCLRPKLKLRVHDFECGLFKVILQRYGDDAVEQDAVDIVLRDWANVGKEEARVVAEGQ